MEECENKYNEALKRAAIVYKGEGKSLKESLEQIFPELKESEDEKIRKWIINEIKVKHHNLDEDNVDFVDKAIAWLEKQGEPNPYSGTSFKYDGHTWGMCARDGGVEVLCDNSIIGWFNPTKEKERGESEVKPKFKVGDWIVTPEGEIRQITNTRDACYIFDHNELHYWMAYYCDQKCRLWTVEDDAKIGDVLMDNDGSFFIFAGYATEGCCKYYAKYNSYYGKIIINENVEDSVNFSAWPEAVHPVTEEEREHFFHLFWGTGYKWDSENRKLIKE